MSILDCAWFSNISFTRLAVMQNSDTTASHAGAWMENMEENRKGEVNIVDDTIHFEYEHSAAHYSSKSSNTCSCNKAGSIPNVVGIN